MRIPSKVNICGFDFKVIKKNQFNCSFSVDNREIIIGIKHKDERDTIEHFIHEISEIIHIELGNRYYKPGNDSYVFMFDHEGFQAHNEILINTLLYNKILKI